MKRIRLFSLTASVLLGGLAMPTTLLAQDKPETAPKPCPASSARDLDYPCVQNCYKMPILGLRSYLPFCPGPTPETYTSDRYSHLQPTFKYCVYPCRYVYPKAIYNIGETPR